MIKGFWKKVAEKAKKEKRPILVAAPLANVTDAAFRRMLAKYGKVSFRKKGGLDVIWTEFVSCDGLCSAGKEILMRDLIFDKSEHPIIAQFFGSNPENFYKCALMAHELGFDGIDINMGCPDKGLVKGGSCAGLIKNPPLAQKIITETMRGAGPLPVSVKTRIGFNTVELETWLPALLETGPAALTLHLRTRKEMSLVPAHWELASTAVALRDRYSPETLFLGNGDVKDLKEAREKVAQTGVDGVMLGRGIFGNPWLFSASARAGRDGAEKLPSVEEKLRVAVEHTKLFVKMFGDNKPFDLMKKHFKAYVNGFDGAKELRITMMEAKTADEIENIVNEFLAHKP